MANAQSIRYCGGGGLMPFRDNQKAVTVELGFTQPTGTVFAVVGLRGQLKPRDTFTAYDMGL